MNVLFALSLKWLNGPVKSKVMLRRSVTWPQSPGQASRKQFTSIVCPSLQVAENLFFLNQQTKKNRYIMCQARLSMQELYKS